MKCMRAPLLSVGVWTIFAAAGCSPEGPEEDPGEDPVCDQLYGDIEGYELCQQTASSCMFYRSDTASPEISCAAICASKAALCLKAYDEGEPGVCDLGAEIPCDQVNGNAVCECGNPSNGGSGGSAGSGGSGGTGAPTECASAGGLRLLARLEWSGGGNLDVGATTPNAPTDIVAANYNEADADPNCTHSGDEPIESGLSAELIGCSPPMVGTYTIQVDNSEAEELAFDLRVTIDAVAIPGFPRSGSVGANGSTRIDFCVE